MTDLEKRMKVQKEIVDRLSAGQNFMVRGLIEQAYNAGVRIGSGMGDEAQLRKGYDLGYKEGLRKNDCYMDGVQYGVSYTNALVFTCSMVVLKRVYGFGLVRLDRYAEALNELYKNTLSPADLKEELYSTGVRLSAILEDYDSLLE